VLEGFAIGFDGEVAIDTAYHVGPVAGLYFAVRGFLEVENVEGFGGAGDDVGRLRRAGLRLRLRLLGAPGWRAGLAEKCVDSAE
jgi:hypothetical protein